MMGRRGSAGMGNMASGTGSDYSNDLLMMILSLLLHCRRDSGKPCALLMPNYVYMKVREGL